MLHLAPLTDLDIGAVAAAVIALLAYRTRSLDAGGAAAAFAVGTATFAALGIRGAAVLLTFFVTSVALSRVGKRRKRTVLIDVGKTGPRDAAQVFANGGVAALCALATHLVAPAFAFAFAGAFAAATADTWGTEVGTLVRQPPRSILTLRPIATGLSGGVTWAGTLAEVAGALLVAVVALPLDRRAFVGVALAGVAGRSSIPSSAHRCKRCAGVPTAGARPNVNRTFAAPIRRRCAGLRGSATMRSTSQRRSWAQPSLTRSRPVRLSPPACRTS